MKTSSKKIPEGKKARIGISIDSNLRGWIFARCFENNVNISQFVTNCIILAQQDKQLFEKLMSKEK